MPASNSSFTRGSQLFLHRLRMVVQGTRAAFGFSFLFGLIAVVMRIFSIISPISLYYWGFVRYGVVKNYIMNAIDMSDGQVSLYFNGGWIDVSVLKFEKVFWRSIYGREIYALKSWFVEKALIEFLCFFIFILVIITGVFIYRGRKTIIKKKLRGNSIVSPKELTRMIKGKKKASDIIIGSVPLIKYTERQHILLTGTTGTGKTTLLHQLLPQIRKRGDRAVIVDVNGSFATTYMKEEDALLNPFETEKTKHWTPWADAEKEYEFDAIASALSGEVNKYDPFWDQSAEKIISTALKMLNKVPNLKNLLYVLNSSSTKVYDRFFKDTDVGALTAKEGDKTVASIRANISNKIKSLSYLKDTKEPFSIKNFLQDSQKSGWLFLTSTPVMRNALRPLISIWVEIALMALMEKEENFKGQNLWFILDELPAMGKIPSLKTALAESRKYGGCIVAGIQNIHQLAEIYGRDEGSNILDNFSTKYIFRVGDQETSSRAARMLGEEETIDTQEALSYGANTNRDGVNLNTIERRRMLVMPTEVMNIPDLACYAKLSGNWPVSKIQLKRL